MRMTSPNDVDRACIALHCRPEEIAEARRREAERLRKPDQLHSIAARRSRHERRINAPRISAEVIAGIRAARAEGATYAELVVRFGVSKGAVCNALRDT